jgi:hypothetical protein
MLQSVGSEHDNHYVASQSNSIEALVAARNDGKKHLLLAYAHHSSNTPQTKHTVALTCLTQSLGLGSHHQEQAYSPPLPYPQAHAVVPNP